MDFKQFYKHLIFDIDESINTLYSAKQGDTKSRGFYVTITQNRVQVPVTTQTMTFYAQKPDRTRVYAEAVKDGDKFRIDLTNQIFAVPGTVKCELTLKGPSGEKISSKTFKMLIDEQLQEGSIISKDERGALDQAIDEFNGIISTEATRITAENTRKSNETSRVQSENARALAEQQRATTFEGYENRVSAVEDDLIQHKQDYAEDKKPFHYNHVSQEYLNIDRYWDSFRNGKIYTSEFNQSNISPSSNGIKKDDNEKLVCEPSTNTVRGRNDYEKIGLFMSINVNAYVDINGDYHVTAIEGDGRFAKDGTMGDVYVMSMVGYQKCYETDTVWGISYSDTMHAGFEVLHEAVKPDGAIRPYLLHAKYAAGRNKHENNNLASISGVYPEYVNMSHNGQITEFKKKGIQYSGKTTHDDYYVQLMMWLKYAVTSSDLIMKGCQSYYLQYTNLVPETGVKRVVITNSQANDLLVGSTVSIGDYGSGSINTSRDAVQNFNVANRVNITAIVDLGDGKSAVYVDAPNAFDTTLTTTISTYPWNSGGCDNVLGQDGSPYNAQSGKEPFILNDIEMGVGGYEVIQNSIIVNNATDNRIDVYVNYDCTTFATSVTSAYDLVGQLAQTNNTWKYGSKMVIPRNHPSVILITEAEASSTTGTGDGIYTNPPSTGGTRAWLSLGDLNGGALCGLRCLSASDSLADAYWSFLGRLSATGRSQRRAGVN